MISTNTLVSRLNRNQLNELQMLLKKLGYYKDVVDGVFGKNTAHAFAEWKVDNYLLETDTIGASSYALLVKQAKELDPRTSINWNDFNSKISKHFTVGEVCKREGRRIPTNAEHRRNAVRLAEKLDEVREAWGKPIGVTSWYRPPAVERAVGGSGANHPFGYAADIYPIGGSIHEFQAWFEKEFYNKGKWNGGFGRGASKGFCHLDLRNRRVWNY
jgi:peptidoglycan hydrolase-like protein with peptidoglycan-binding domain